VIARLVVWNLADSLTSLDELRAQLPELPDGAHWLANEAQDTFGVFALGELPDLAHVQELLGVEPVVGEEFDVLD
jgi:hypothetical protein